MAKKTLTAGDHIVLARNAAVELWQKDPNNGVARDLARVLHVVELIVTLGLGHPLKQLSSAAKKVMRGMGSDDMMIRTSAEALRRAERMIASTLRATLPDAKHPSRRRITQERALELCGLILQRMICDDFLWLPGAKDDKLRKQLAVMLRKKRSRQEALTLTPKDTEPLIQGALVVAGMDREKAKAATNDLRKKKKPKG